MVYMFYFYCQNKIKNNGNTKLSKNNLKFKALTILSIFHKPKIKYSSRWYVNSNQWKLISKFTPRTQQFRCIYGFNKPFIYIQQCRQAFLYTFFLKSHKSSLSFIFKKCKAVPNKTILRFFTNTVGYVLNHLKLGHGSWKNTGKLILLNNLELVNYWNLTKPGDVYQTLWKSSYKTYPIQRYSPIMQGINAVSSYIKLTGIYDMRTNSFVTVSLTNQNNMHNLLNLSNTSIYNWKIIT